MGKLKIECLQKKLKLKKLAKAVYTVLGQTANLKAELVFEASADMTELNRSSRGVNSVTDVLSFPSLDGIRGEVLQRDKCNTELDGKYIFIGSIVLCEAQIRSQAAELGHSEEAERDYLIIHGLMHLMGYDHLTPSDKKEMREKEKAAVAYLAQIDKKYAKLVAEDNENAENNDNNDKNANADSAENGVYEKTNENVSDVIPDETAESLGSVKPVGADGKTGDER